MIQKILFTIFLLGGILNNSQAQEVWSLEKCVKYAIQNSLTIKQSQLAISQADLNDQSNRYARYPNLNASSNFGYQFGRTIDPTTNSFINKAAGSNTWSISSNVLLYNGGRINNSIEQAEYDLEASKADYQQTQNDIALNVATTYLNILFAEEQLANAERRLALTQAQLEQTDKLIRAGSLPANDRLDLLANTARDEQAIVQQQNSVDLAYLNLKQLLELDPTLDIRIDKPAIEITSDNSVEGLAMQSVYNSAINAQPFIKAGEFRHKSAELGVDIARANMLPRLSLFGSVDTRYSTEAFVQNGFDIEQIPLIFLDPSGTEQTLQILRESPIFQDSPYFDQLGDNLGQTVGLSLSIPIYNNHQTKINMERAELNITNTQIANERNKQQLKSDIQTAIANAKAAKKQLEASEKTVSALQAAYENAQKKLNLGAINTFELTSSKNALDSAEVDYIVAKYDYLFKLKVVDYYMGNPIKL